MLDAADIPHEGSAVMAESAWLAAAKSMLQKLMFEDLSFRHRHKHLRISDMEHYSEHLLQGRARC